MQTVGLTGVKDAWGFSNLRSELLSGITVALALIPEAIAFSIIAGVDPMVGLYASFCIAVVTAFAGGRPGMISAATGAMAVLMVTLVKEYGIEYLFAATAHFIDSFDYHNDPEHVIVDFGGSHVWDHSGVNAIFTIVEKYEALGKRVTLTGLNQESVRILERQGLALQGS